mgnify:CR=1 FL=1
MPHWTFADEAHWRVIVISGHVDLSYITHDMLTAIEFNEFNEVSHGNGLWEELGIETPPYHTGSTIVHQTFDTACPVWVKKIKKQFDWVSHSTVTLNKLTPGNYIPPHADTLFRLKQYLKDHDLDISGSELVRVNIFLQNKEIGHFLDMGNQAVSSYTKGDYVLIRPGVIHTVANLGYTDRYTMQITGIIKKES